MGSHALKYTQQRTIHQLPNQESIQPSKITQQALQPPALQYRQTHGIENIETDAIDYQAQQLLQYTQPQAITHTKRPNILQTESPTIYNIPQDAISHTQPSTQ